MDLKPKNIPPFNRKKNRLRALFHTIGPCRFSTRIALNALNVRVLLWQCNAMGERSQKFADFQWISMDEKNSCHATDVAFSVSPTWYYGNRVGRLGGTFTDLHDFRTADDE